MYSKGIARPYISFLGNSSSDVTGSMYLIRFNKYKVLLDCGLIQLNDPMSSYKANQNQLKKIKPTEIQYVILSHCHVDHSGMIPALFARGCHAHVYVPMHSKPLLKLLWLDSMKIMQSDSIKLQNKHNLKAPAFYNEYDIDNALNRCIEVPFNYLYNMTEDMSFTYYPSGHIICAAQIYIELHVKDKPKCRIGYTGDIGSNKKKYFTYLRQELPFVNILIGENTYNTPARPNKAVDRKKDIEKIITIIEESNKIIIPTFSLGRTQEILTLLYTLYSDSLITDVPIYLDSPLSKIICDIYENIVDTEEYQNILWEDVYNWKNLHVIQDWNESVELQNRDEHCVILSASGFLNGGRVLSHIKSSIENSNNHIIFVGYAGDNNLASQIKNGEREIYVDGELCKNNANITELRSFSSHASYEELIDYYVNLRYNKICLVHGNQENKVNFCKTLQQKLIDDGRSSRVIYTNQDQKIYL